MKAMPVRLDKEGKYEVCAPADATHVKLNLPGPFPERVLPFGPEQPWQWDLNTERPTIQPSIKRIGRKNWKEQICHCFVTDGMARFLDDTTHDLAGKSAELLDVE